MEILRGGLPAASVGQVHCAEQRSQGNNESFSLAGVSRDGRQFVRHCYMDLKSAAKMKKAS